MPTSVPRDSMGLKTNREPREAPLTSTVSLRQAIGWRVWR